MASGDIEIGDGRRYRSPFSSWENRASVRTAPERKLGDVTAEELFPTGLVPLASVPSIAEDRTLRDRVITTHLLRYLRFTAKLEHLVVNQVAMGIANDGFGFLLPELMREDAYRIYCDEGYHALFSARIAGEVSARFGVELEQEPPFFLVRIGVLLEQAGAELSPLVFLLFVICSETLISRTLLDVGRETDVAQGVKDMVEDHARDESRHHAYFAALLREVWVQLSPGTRRRVGPLVPELINTFLEPDRPGMIQELMGYGFDREKAEETFESVFDQVDLLDEISSTSRHTIRHFVDVGALDDTQTEEAFAKAGLWPSSV